MNASDLTMNSTEHTPLEGNFSTNITNINTTQPMTFLNPSEGMIEFDIANVMDTFISPTIFIFGIISNILSFLVFSTKEFSFTLSSFLYRLLAILDVLALLAYDGLHTIPTLFDVNIIALSNLSCKMFCFSFFTIKSFAAWILVVIGLERVIGVLLPHKAKILNTRYRYSGLLLGIFTFILIMFKIQDSRFKIFYLYSG